MDGSCSPLGPADLYVHLGADGCIFVASGDAPDETAWVTLDDLSARVGRVAADGRIWLSVPQESSLTAEPAEVVRRSAVPVIAAPARPDTRRAVGVTALMAAASVGAHRLVRDLVARRAPVDSSDEKGTTALMIAAQAGETEIVDTLHGAGADLDATDAEGTTALMLAAWEGHTDTVRRLVALGADQRLERRRPGDPQGRPIDAYGFARDAGHPETAAALRPRSAAWAPDPQPVVFTAKPRRSFFMVPAAIPALVTVLAIFSGTLADVAIGIAMTGFFALPMELLYREMRRARLEFHGSSVTVRMPLRRTRVFDTRDVVRIRRRTNKGGVGYAIRLRGDGSGHGERAYIGMTLFGTPQAYDHLLSRIAAAPAVDADPKTAKVLESWHQRVTRS